jgi:hypothetical protein
VSAAWPQVGHEPREQLLAEWYEYRAYFLRRNVLVGKRKHGGYECELDIVGFHPIARHLLHIEPSMDAMSWEQREQRIQKKFDAGRSCVIPTTEPLIERSLSAYPPTGTGGAACIPRCATCRRAARN